MQLHRVFISSTIDDLQNERESVDKELSSLGFFEIIRVEKLPATNKPSERVCLDEVAKSEALILILDRNYGYVPPKGNPESLSVTHIEYRKARRLGLRVYAYIRNTEDRDSELDSFVKEVSDYHEGLFRRLWSSVDELRFEVRRTAINWLSTDLRSGASDAALGLVAAEIGSYPIDLSSSELESPGTAQWLSDFLKLLETSCRERFLPIPVLGSAASNDFKMIVQTCMSGTGLRVNISLLSKQSKNDVTLHIVLEVGINESGVKTAVDTSLALVQAGGGDIPGAIKVLLETESDPSISLSNRERLLQSAANISSLSKGEQSNPVVREILTLPHLQPATVNAGILCLFATLMRCEFSGATRAKQETEILTIDLLLAAHERSDAKLEMIYNLGRQVLKHSPQLGLSIYNELLRVEPSYEERWYFHRDLGLVAYSDGRYTDAGDHYDRACNLKQNDSELWRQAGDARYYNGEWAEALLRYEEAMGADSVEECYLDMKIRYSRAKIAEGFIHERGFPRRFKRSKFLGRLGQRFVEAERNFCANVIFRLAKIICTLCFDADRGLALNCNRQGKYDLAIHYLENALAAVPEDPYVRLNLVANHIFCNKGLLNEDAKKHARIALFHGGPEILSRFAVQMSNTVNRENLVVQMRDVFTSVAQERSQWLERRRAVQEPANNGEVIHFEFR